MKMIRSLFLFFSIVVVVVIAVSTVKTLNPNRIFRSNAHSQRLLLQSTSFSTSIAKLTASNGESYDLFGSDNAVAISKNRIVVGAPGYEDDRGAAYLFGDPRNPQSGRSYSQLAFLMASDGEMNDYFGNSVAVDGDIIVVGASELNSGGPGAAYVYRIIADENNNFVSISQVAKLTASNGMVGDWFGGSVAMHGKYILVGAGVVNSYSGSAYLFGNPSNNPNTPEWTELKQFQPNDLTEDDSFGYSVAMDDNVAVIGADGANAAYVFAPVDSSSSSSSLSTSWTLTAKLTGSTVTNFGSSVAVTGNWIAVGDNTNGNDAGAAFVFTKMSSSSTWTQMTQLLAADGAEYDYFGTSVSITEDASTIVVGAHLVDLNSTIYNSGAVYMFRTINSTTTTVQWTQMGKFVAADPDTGDGLGSSIAVENNIVVVGADGDDSNTGSVYVVDTGFSSSMPPTTTPTAVPTTSPTTTPVTPEPTLGRTFNPTIPPSLDNSSSSTPLLPMTNSPAFAVPVLPPTTTTAPSPRNIDTDPTNSPIPNNSTTQPQAAEEQPNSESRSVFTPGAIVGMSTILGVVVIVLGISFFNYRIKIQREAREQQQQQAMNTADDPILPLPPLSSYSGNIPAAETADDGTTTPIMADAVELVVPPPAQEARDVTLEADAFLDPAAAAAVAAKTVAATAATAITNPTKKELPRYKDQVRAVQPPGPSTNPPSLPKRNHQRRDQDDPQQ
jgi:hypothetical protein